MGAFGYPATAPRSPLTPGAERYIRSSEVGSLVDPMLTTNGSKVALALMLEEYFVRMLFLVRRHAGV
jgi:hypothetical protein